ncbi:MAG: hypothetical protein GY787_04915 [Alteromonadales bacterium]|nr:hypothetical protein [Alteromonadales bacterium]
MENFDLTKYLVEGKLHEAMSPQDVVDIAQMIADEFTKEDAEGDRFSTYMIHKVGNIDGMSFELDTEATEQTPERDAKYGTGEGWGGMFRIKPTEDGYEIRNSEKGGLVAIIDNMGNFRMLSADESRAEMGMADGEKTDYMERRRETDDYMQETLVDADQDMAEAILNALGGEAAFEALVRAMSTDDAQVYLGGIMRDYDIEMGPVGDVPGFEGTMDALDALSIREEDEMLNEGILDTIKDKMVSVGKKLLSKFSPEEQASMKAAAEKVLGSNYSKEDITLDKAKEIGKIISGGLDESQELDENLRKKIGGALVGLGLPTAFVAGHGFGGTDVGAITAGIGIAAAMLGWVMTAVDESQEIKETKSNKMKKSELKEMIKAAMLEDARTDAEQEGYKDGFEDAKDDIEAELKKMKVSEADEEVNEAEDVEVEDNENIDVDIEKDIKVDDEESEVDIDVKASMPGESEDVEEVQALLMKAQEAATDLGDEKLTDQIGNTITYFTRSHVARNVSEADLDMDLSVGDRAEEAEIGLEEKKQGYNDKLDDAEGAKHGKKKQDMKQRRADSENMEKADGKRKFAGDSKMDKKNENLNESVMFPMWNKIK